MDFEAYSDLKLNTPFEEKSRTKFDSGMDNLNGEPGSSDKARGWQLMWALIEKLAYPLPPASQARPGGPAGSLKTFASWTGSSVYPGTRRTWWYYVPAEYDGKTPANLAIFLDGAGFLDSGGNFRAREVLDSLAAEGLLRPTVAVFVNPGVRPKHPDCAYSDQDASVEVGDDPQRSLEFDSVSDRISRFLLEDILPVVEKSVNITQDPRLRAVVGMSSSAVGAFCAAWFRPDKFGLVSTYVGSFVNIRESHHLPWIIRNTRRKPIRVSLQSGERDMDNNHGSWSLGNREMAAALKYAGYEHKLDLGPGSHYGSSQGGSLFAGTLLWLFGSDPSRCAPCQAETGGVLRAAARLAFWLCSPTGAASEL
uniref:Esterase n=1 Tax=Alexandrium catenella TaxID=2925 RepID=A0A7S1RZD8_ALECA